MGCLTYNEDLFDVDAMAAMTAHFVNLLTSAMEVPAAPAANLPLMQERDRSTVLNAFNNTSRPFDMRVTLIDRFEVWMRSHVLCGLVGEVGILCKVGGTCRWWVACCLLFPMVGCSPSQAPFSTQTCAGLVELSDGST
eukprot:366023-Chlamydomonas_euryale.AAC.8